MFWIVSLYHNYKQTLNNMIDLFSTPIRKRKVRSNIYAYQYANGTININGNKYLMYNMTDAINKFRKDFPTNKH